MNIAYKFQIPAGKLQDPTILGALLALNEFSIENVVEDLSNENGIPYPDTITNCESETEENIDNMSNICESIGQVAVDTFCTEENINNMSNICKSIKQVAIEENIEDMSNICKTIKQVAIDTICTEENKIAFTKWMYDLNNNY